MASVRIKLLLVEHNRDDARRIQELLSHNDGATFEVVFADRLASALECLRAHTFDAILLNLSLPDSTGFEALTAARRSVANVPIVLLTDAADPELAVASAREGAQDYLVKAQLDADLLLRAVRYAIERERVEARLRHRNKIMQMLQDVTVAANEAPTLAEAMRFSLDRVCGLTRWPVGHVFVAGNERDGAFVSSGIWYLRDPERFANFRKGTEQLRLQPGGGLTTQVLATGRPAWLTEAPKNPNLKRAKLAEAAGLHSAFAFPVLEGKNVVAVLEFFSEAAQERDEILLDAITLLGIQLGRVTERKRAQATLQAVIDAVPAMISAKDSSSRYILMNKYQAQLYGIAQEAAIGKTAAELLGEQYGAYTRELDQKVIATRQPTPAFEEQYVDAHGVRRTAWTTKVPLGEGGKQGVATISLDISERKRMEEDLRNSQRRLAEAARIARVGNWERNILADEVHWSDETYHIFGLQPQQLVPTLEVFLNCVHPAEREFVRNAITAALYEKRPYSIDYRVVRPEGEVRMVHAEAEVTFDEAGKPVRIAGTVQDITERKRLDEAFRRYERIVSTSSDLMAFVDGDYVYQAINAAYAQAFGKKAEEICGHTVAEVLGKDRFVTVIKPHLDECLKGRSINYQHWLDLPAAGLRYLDVHYDPFYENDGSVSAIVVGVRDITERKRAEERLQTSEAEYRSLFENVLDGVYRSDVEGKLLAANPALVHMLGYASEAELLAADTAELYVDPEESIRWTTIAAGAGKLRNLEVSLKRKDGQSIIALLNAHAVRNKAGRLLRYEGTFTDITERKRYEDQLAYLANYDPLTNIFNRRRFEEELENQLAHARRYESKGALLWLDLDQFKEINDSFGHRTGNELLASIANILREGLRETDVIARLGGDEFGILLPEADEQQVRTFTHRVLDQIRQHAVTIKGEPIRVTASAGIVLFSDNNKCAEDLLAQADLAMFQAKDDGRNRFTLFTPDKDWQTLLEARVTWARRIREGLEQDRFVLYAQPILNLNGSDDCVYELLLRLKGEHDKIIAPGAFLDVAERFGLAPDIDGWVAGQAIQLLEQQQRAGRKVRLEVNLSAKALTDERVLALIESRLGTADVDPASLVWEVTETSAIADISRAKVFIGTLKQLGCQFALDDFGIGFSSFHHLKHLPVDYLKIDGSFIRNLAHDAIDQHLVQAMVEVAQGLGKRTIAEFVEDEQTLQLLRRYGVDYAQGYHIGRPSPALEALLQPPAARLRRG